MKIRAIASFKPTKAGGRANDVKTGYRPEIKFGQKSSAATFVETPTIKPGDKDEVVLEILGTGTRALNNLEKGMTFDIVEIDKTVGAGIIIEVIK